MSLPIPVDTPPSFRNLTPETLSALNESVGDAAGGRILPVSVVAKWAEKLLRYCEIFQSTLKRRFFEKWNDKGEASHRANEMTAFFLAYYKSSRDLRFLNVALKLAEIRWISVSGEIQAKLDAEIVNLETEMQQNLYA
jgi:hypothetical protein